MTGLFAWISLGAPMYSTLFGAKYTSDTRALCVNIIQLDDILLTGITKHTPDVWPLCDNIVMVDEIGGEILMEIVYWI